MFSRTLNQVVQSPWARLVWAAIAVLVLVQVVAFYRLCTGQVERARAREAIVLEQRNMLTDCLDSVHKSTISSCSRQGVRSADAGSRMVRDLPQGRFGAQSAFGGAVPVSYIH